MELLLVVVLLLAFLGWFGGAPIDYTADGVIHLVLGVLVVVLIVWVLRSTWR